MEGGVRMSGTLEVWRQISFCTFFLFGFGLLWTAQTPQGRKHWRSGRRFSELLHCFLGGVGSSWPPRPSEGRSFTALGLGNGSLEGERFFSEVREAAIQVEVFECGKGHMADPGRLIVAENHRLRPLERIT